MIESLIILPFSISLMSLIIFRPLAIKFNLLDVPNKRKDHIGNVPLIGGICILLATITSYFSFIEFNKFSNVLLFTASLILIQGVWDDFVNLQAKTKLTFQLSITTIMIYIVDVKIESFGFLFSMDQPIALGILSIPITVIAVVGLTNAINMIDGLDGLAASLVLIAIMGLLAFNTNLEVSYISQLLLVVAFALIPFLIFNFVPNSKIKVFLGDGGSLFLGYIISWAIIYCAENINELNPSFGLWCVAIPLFDLFTVIIIRIIDKRSLIIADRDHIHHFIHDLGFSKITTCLLIASIGFTLLLLGMFLEAFYPILSFPIFLILFFCYLFIRYINIFKKKV